MRGSLGRPTVAFLVASVVVIVVVGTLAILWRDDGQVFDRGELVRLIELKNEALADLENIPNERGNDGSRSTKAFAKILRLLPNEPMGPRNLAIAHLLILGTIDQHKSPDEFANAAKTCRTSIETLKQHDSRGGIPHILAARLAIQTSDRDSARDEYKAACKKMPDDPLPWLELFVLLKDEAADPLRTEALKRASAARPNNLVLLRSLVLHQAEIKDAFIADTLKQAHRILRPLNKLLQEHGIELEEEIDAFVTRLKQKDQVAFNDIRVRFWQLFNVVMPQLEFQTDMRRLEQHPLELVVADFSKQFYERFPRDQPDAAEPDGVDVKFVAAFANGALADIDEALDVALCDFDLDGRFDLIVLRKQSIEVYSLDAKSQKWRSIVQAAVPAGMNQLLLADFDRDSLQGTARGGCQKSDLDVLVYGRTGCRFLENKQVGTDRRKLIAVPSPPSLGASAAIHAAAVADVEHDGDLDVLLATDTGLSIWTNRENWTFAKSKQQLLGATEASSNPYTTIVAVDWNRDVLTDVLVASKTSSGRLENMRHGRFRWRAFDKKMISTDSVNSLATCDADSNASWDVLACGHQGVTLTLTRTRPGESVRPLNTVSISNKPSHGATPWDYDNDGHVDVVAWGDEGIQIFRGRGDGSFVDATASLANSTTAVDQCAVGDIDHDGDQDLVVVSNGAIRCYINAGGNKNHWIDIQLSAEPDAKFKVQRTNLYGIGSMVELRAGESYQAQTANGQVVHFGLGSRKKADAIRVLWTNGIPQNVTGPATNQTICEQQRLLKGSCPYLYTWTGKRYEFFTDLLWAAPIGLQVAEGKLMPSRSWEYIFIPGERLSPAAGEYRLQVTEELWEAAYFDVVQLIAIDHPADVSVFSNEKVGPPAIAKHFIHTIPTKSLVPPVAARDSRGRDVLSLVRHRDNRFARLFDARHKQGLIDEHFIEIDLGKLNKPKSIKLVLTGWVFPTDTSINVAISQNPTLEPPKPPSIWVPRGSKGGQTQWKEVVHNMGFPGGKTKTIVVEVPVDQFTDADYRLRIVTSMELYWDAIAAAVDAPGSKYHRSPLQLLAANLHYRGFSARREGKNNGPESYDYDDIELKPIWPPMSGNFTRYGNVKDLVESADDRLVVLGAGDEMTLRFKQTDPPPAGWRRDFILYSVGWDKDADLNTVTGSKVEPLPYRGMSQYPPGLNDTPPNSKSYVDYLRNYQTREQNNWFWSQLRFRYNPAD